MKKPNSNYQIQHSILLPNVLHIERFSINAIIGSTITPEPKFEIISKNPTVVVPSSALVVLKLGLSKFGKPEGTLPRRRYYTVFYNINVVHVHVLFENENE